VRWNFLLFILLCFPAFSGAETPDNTLGWSQPVKGLRARLLIEPGAEGKSDGTFEVRIEFEEVGIETSLGLTHFERKFSFSKSWMNFTVQDQTGRVIAPTGALSGNETVPVWDLVLPPGGRISLPIGKGGRDGKGIPPLDSTSLSFGIFAQWLIPAGSHFRLSATFSSDSAWHGSAWKDVHDPWTGKLALPAIEVPTN
jgi:hypothetical protein